MTEPETPERQRGRNDHNQRQRAPFDTSELNNIPRATDEDPPYQNWWVVNDHDGR